MTEPLFRFLILRPPVAQDPANPSIVLAQQSDFQIALATAATSADPRAAMVSTAKAFIASDKFIASTSQSAFQKQVGLLSAMFDKLDAAGILDVKAVLNAVKQVFGKEPADVVKSAEFLALLGGLKDSITAIKYVQEDHSLPIAELTDQLRDLELVLKAVETSPPPPPVSPSLAGGSESRQTTMTGGVETKTETTWKADQNYKVGDRVRHKGIIYQCLQAHKSQSDWPPDLTPALWKAVDVTPPQPPPITANLYRKRSLLLPVEADLKSIFAASVEERKKAEEDRKKAAQEAEEEAAALLKKYAEVKAAVEELVKLSPDHLDVKEQLEQPGFDIDEKFGKSQVLMDQQAYVNSLRQTALGRTALPLTGAQGFAALADPPAPAPVLTEPVGAFGLAKDLLSTPGLLMPKATWKPVPPEDRTPRLKSSALAELSATTKTVLNDHGIDIQKEPLNRIIKRLRRELDVVLNSLKSLSPLGDNVSFTRMGSAFISTRSPILSRTTALLFGHKVPKGSTALPALPLDGRIPHTKGKVTPAGVADLLVVKQTLTGYEAADIAHVENVLKGESKQRTHTKTTRTETTVFTESETTNNEEHELASTTRFEMSKETSNTLKEDASLKAELKVSAKYGPAVTVDASVQGSISRNKEEVSKAASKYSQDVTERTVKKITERVLQKQNTVTINEIVEVNQHGINNANGTGHISGVYQWLNKKYKAQVFNYGLRMMFEFMIPEPGAFLTYVLSAAATANSAEANLVLEKPDIFDKTPSEITVESIGALITKYQATDVLPPPEDYITVSDQAKFGGADSHTNYDHGATLSIPSGYEAVYATMSLAYNVWEGKHYSVDLMVGGETTRLQGGSVWGTSVINYLGSDSEATGGTITWAFNTLNCSDGVVGVEVLCRVTERRKQQWQAETHAKLVTAYKARMAEYDEQLARLKLDTGIAIQGTNPTANLVAIKSELKKNCISVLTAQHYDLFNAIKTNPQYGYPEIDLYEAEAEGRYVRFFEQAFEWDQIMYITYPYFWARQDTWIKKLAINDPDPVFDEFLKAGFARVVVPARPGFEGAIDHFMQLGETWDGGPLPPITSKLYVPIADEVAERSGRPQGELPQGEPWEVTLPTTLVKLRADDQLPTWPDAGA